MEPIRQQVVVGAAGRIVIQVPQLAEGIRAEVIVVQQAPPETGEARPARRSSLIASCPRMFGSPREADDFLARERDAWGS